MKSRRRHKEKQSSKLAQVTCRLLKMNFASSIMLLLLCSLGETLALSFDQQSNSYSGLTFTFDPRLERRLEFLHAEHWNQIMQQSSSMLYSALNGRAYLNEVRVLIPYKWRHLEWPLLHKPGSPIMVNRRLRYSDADILVGFEGKFGVC